MFNFCYLLHPSCCAYYCLKKIDKNIELKRKSMMSIAEVEKVLKENNYMVNCYKLDELEENKLPYLTLIVKKKKCHYLIVNNIKNNIVYYYDPLFLKQKKKKTNKFIKVWSYIAIFYSKNS